MPSSDQNMKLAPQPRNGRAVMWLLIVLSVSIVGATVLLSNDMRHLKSLARSFGIELFPPAAPPPPPPPKIFRRTEPVSIKIAPRTLDLPQPALASAFLRTWRISGPVMCEALRSAGVETSEWAETAFNSDTFECSYEHVYKKEKEHVVSSLFLVVRGNGRGMITSMRVKLVGPATDSNGQLDPAIVRIFETMLTQPAWLDFHDALTAIRNLKDVKEEGFGVLINFTQEYSRPGAFNFTLLLQENSAQQRRTKDYFSPKTWLPAPDPSWQVPEFIFWRRA
ncbi:DUF6030 family protein [Rhizobium mesosinicum]|uniref:Exopolysaccharide biosynthesis protein n=1 Tax=Rhizobium mesosinicum TaxID=335017 RepID=A0ABS7H240_9HYPH|nr:DUF6030 family protein [Rhizobium mesosinicum]MBW9056299.1 exopolysaccharide biosynthesis protein [Rhizobium mesosinicum]